MELLKTHNLAIGYGTDRRLQENLNFTVSPGETVALMGQNGVGKTTFLKTVNGLIPALAGEVSIHGQLLSSLSRAQLAQQCSLVLTTKPTAGNLTVYEVVALGRHPYSNWLGFLNDEDRKIIQRAIDLTKINYLASRRISELSDGQLQKVMIARALAQDTPLIILDEPVAHLDLYNKIEVMLLLREIARQGKGVLISTHDVQVVTQLADELWLFGFQEAARKGIPEDLILDGSLEHMLFLSGHPYDLVHHRLEWSTAGPIIHTIGEEKAVYWTQQALSRRGFRFGDSDVMVQCEKGLWKIGDQQFESIASFLPLLQSLTSSRHS